jgi:hypothetical protein
VKVPDLDGCEPPEGSPGWLEFNERRLRQLGNFVRSCLEARKAQREAEAERHERCRKIRPYQTGERRAA